MADFKINEFGEIIRNGVNTCRADDKTEQGLYAEYKKLEYEIFSHPERWTPKDLAAKRERVNFIKQKLNIKETNPFVAARKKLANSGNNSVLKQRIDAFKKQNG